MYATKNTTPTTDDATVAAFKRRFLIRLTAVLIGGMFLDGYILGIIGTVIGTITTELSFTPLWEGLIVASSLVGILVGSPVGGWLGDRFGRKPLFMIDMGLFVIGSALQFVVHEPWQLFLVRLLMGIAVGVEYSVGWPLMSEFAPARIRGRLMGLTLVAFYVGFTVAFIMGYALTTSATVDWRIILGSSTLPAVILFFARLGLPESPRWLWNKGRHDEARAVAHRYMADASDMDDVEHEPDRAEGKIRALFSHQYWRATLFCSMFWLCAVTPYFAIATFAGSVLEGYGLSHGLAGGVGLSAVATAGVILTVVLIDRAGRRVLTVPPQWVCFVLLLIIGLWAGAPAWVVLACFLAFSFLNAGYTTLTGIYPGEVFPTEIRGIGTGFATAVSRVGAGAGTFLLPWSMVTYGPQATMLIAAGITLVGAILSQWLAPETKGKTLTETAAGFSH
ncbi:MFS transporter [Arthrobacter sp. GCM10027362]|uniref:MFS transporter n=1 Tax=Arthrobacter sp. GCM10027362 TaxID=3273379 RepID=UPI0036304284